MKKFDLESDQKLKHLIVEKNYSKKKQAKIGTNSDDDLPLNRSLKFPTLTIINRCVFQEIKKLFPQIYLGEYTYEL